MQHARPPRVELTPRPSRHDELRYGRGAADPPGCSAVPQPPGPGTPQVRGGVCGHGATGCGKDTLEPNTSTIVDPRTLNPPYAELDQLLAAYTVGAATREGITL